MYLFYLLYQGGVGSINWLKTQIYTHFKARCKLEVMLMIVFFLLFFAKIQTRKQRFEAMNNTCIRRPGEEVGRKGREALLLCV